METRVEVDSGSPQQCQLEAEEPKNNSELTPEESLPEKDIMEEPIKTTTVSSAVSPCLEDFLGELSKTTNLSSEVSPAKEMEREEEEPSPLSPEISVSTQNLLDKAEKTSPLSFDVTLCDGDNAELPEKSAPLSVDNQDIPGGTENSSPLLPEVSLENHEVPGGLENSSSLVQEVSLENHEVPGGLENSSPLVQEVSLENHDIPGGLENSSPLVPEVSLENHEVPGGLENSSPLVPEVSLENNQLVQKTEGTPPPSQEISVYKQPLAVPGKFASFSAEITSYNQSIMEEKVKVSMGQSVKTFEKRHTVEVRPSGTLVSTEVTLHKQLEGEPAKVMSLTSEVALFQQMEEMGFPSREAFISHAREIAERCGHGISILRSKDKCVYLKCDQGGEYRNWRNIEDDFRRRVTCTRLLNCPFRLKGNEVKGVWSLLISDTNHNHPLSENLIGHSRCRRMSDGQAETLKTLTKSGVKASEVLATIRSMDGSTPIAAKDVYNARNKTKLEEVDRLDGFLTELKTKFQSWPLDRRIAALSQLATLVYEPEPEPGQAVVVQPLQAVPAVQPVEPVQPVQSVPSVQPAQLFLGGQQPVHSVQRGSMIVHYMGQVGQSIQPVQQVHQPLQVVLAIEATPKKKMSKLKVRQVGEKNKRVDLHMNNEMILGGYQGGEGGGGGGGGEPPLKTRKCGVCGEFGHNRASCPCRKILNSV